MKTISRHCVRVWCGLLVLNLLLIQFVSEASRTFSVDGHASHGVNSFNSERLVDFSTSSRIFHTAGPIHEVGVLDPDPAATNGSRITSETPLTIQMATIDAWDLQEYLGLPKGVGPFNVPLAETPTLHVYAKSVNDRLVPRPFAESVDGHVVALPYRSAGASADIRLEQWNAAASRITGQCDDDGTATATLRIRNGLPNALYTMLDIGVTDPLTDKERVSIAAFGGIPNVLTTDSEGNGHATRKVMYCPLDKCEGAVRCTLYVSLFYHFDHSIYGASPALDGAGPAAGNVGANQLQMFFNGAVLQAPKNAFDEKPEEKVDL